MRIADWDGFQVRGDATPRSAASSWAVGLANYVEVLDRRAQGAGPHHGHARAPRRRRHRHPAGRPRPRDQLRPGDGGSCSACRSRASTSSWATPTWCSVGGGSHSGRSMRHAATVFSKAAADADRQGQAHRRAHPRHHRRIASMFSDGRFAARETNRSFDFFELAARRSRAGTALPDGSRRRPRRRHRQRDARSGVSERLRGLRGRDRSRDRRARASPAMPASTMSGAASIR